MRIISVTGVSLMSIAGIITWAAAASAQTTTTTTTTATDPQTDVSPPTTATTVVNVQQPSAPPQTTTTTSAPVLVEQPNSRESTTYSGTMPNFYLIGTGAVIFGGLWIASAAVGAESSHQGDNHLWIPLVGPWLDFGDRGALPPGNGQNSEMTDRVFLVLDGVFQAVGTLEILSGFIFPTSHYEKQTVRESKNGAFKPEIHLMPVQLDARGYGMGAIGRF
jgi:hypothetical protein